MFTEEERQVFCYHDGREKRFADPLRVQRRLLRATDGELYEVWREAAGLPQDGEAPPDASLALEAEERLLAAAREAFEMAPFDPATGEGATDRHCWEALQSFSEYVAKKRKGGGTSPTSAPPTGQAPCPAP